MTKDERVRLIPADYKKGILRVLYGRDRAENTIPKMINRMRVR